MTPRDGNLSPRAGCSSSHLTHHTAAWDDDDCLEDIATSRMTPRRVTAVVPTDVRKRKPQNSLNPSDAKKPLLESAPSPPSSQAEPHRSDIRPDIRSQIPRRVSGSTGGQQSPKLYEKRAASPTDRSFGGHFSTEGNAPRTKVAKKSKSAISGNATSIDSWITQYQKWSDQEQKIALKKLIDLAAPNNVRYMREGTDPTTLKIVR